MLTGGRRYGRRVTDLPALLASTVAELERRGTPDEALAVLRTTRLRGTRLVRTGRAWRLGVLLIDREGRLYETATVTRAVEPLRGVTNRSAEAEARRELRHIAARSGFPEGEAVNVDPVPLDPSAAEGGGPLSVVDGTVMVRWNAGGGIRPLEAYLADRLSLLDE
ncbi:MAG: hypothetical protein KKH51_16050 [Actinobacteria bacterium]|nr:hypothetical protein [Actinomycetota bacterium]